MIPYDLIASKYVLPMAMDESGEPLPSKFLHVPEWVVESDIKLLPVHYTDTADTGIKVIIDKRRNRFCKTLEQSKQLITQVRYS